MKQRNILYQRSHDANQGHHAVFPSSTPIKKVHVSSCLASEEIYDYPGDGIILGQIRLAGCFNFKIEEIRP